MTIAHLQQHYMEQPFEVAIETQTVCNATCTFCPYTTLDRRGNKMDDSLLYGLIEQMSEFQLPFFFSPFKLSDPLLDVRLEKLLQRFARDCPVGAVRIFTNGSALTPRRIAELTALPKVELWISLNEFDPDKYRTTMGLDYARTLRNIDRLYQAEFPHPVAISKVGQDPAFRRFCANRWPGFKVVTIKRDGWLGKVDPENSDVPGTPCGRWWEMSIMSDGTASLCCMDSDGEHAIGNVSDTPLVDVYNAWDYRRGRDRADISPCNRCTY